MKNGLSDRQPFDPLRAPFGANFGTGYPPDFLSVGLEKQFVQLAAETADEELLEVLNPFRRKDHTAHITQADAKRAPEAQIHQGAQCKLDGILEEFIQEVNARYSGTNQHLPVSACAFGIRCDRQPLEPPIHDAVALREKPVAPHVHPISFVIDGSRNAAHVRTALKDDGPDVRSGG